MPVALKRAPQGPVHRNCPRTQGGPAYLALMTHADTRGSSEGAHQRPASVGRPLPGALAPAHWAAHSPAPASRRLPAPRAGRFGPMSNTSTARSR
eukprot:scaffold377_cov563-Prasinococcus_capsulatus_cf.AAC.22